MPRDQFDYNGAIAESSKQQLPLNLVRLRYSETPVFLKVSSLISQSTRGAAADARIDANTGVDGENTAAVGGNVRWIDRPTITYAPLSGQELSRNLLTPIRPRALIELLQAGWPPELVLDGAAEGPMNLLLSPQRAERLFRTHWELARRVHQPSAAPSNARTRPGPMRRFARRMGTGETG